MAVEHYAMCPAVEREKIWQVSELEIAFLSVWADVILLGDNIYYFDQ